MKSVVTFVLGAVLAGGIAYFAMRKPADPGPAAVPATVAIPSAAPVEAPASERSIPPEPVRQTEHASLPKSAASFRRADNSLRPSTSPLVNQAPAVQEATPISVAAAISLTFNPHHFLNAPYSIFYCFFSLIVNKLSTHRTILKNKLLE